jgi:hypothetical protein
MDTIEKIFTWGVPLLVIYFLYQSKKEQVQLNLIFQELARDNQGTVNRRTWFDYPRLTIHDHGFTFHLGISLATGGNVWITRLNMNHQQAIDFELRLQPHNRLEKFASSIGFQDAAIGSPTFNDSYLVKTNNAVKSRQFINEELQQDLLQLSNLNPELSITKTAIVLTTSFSNHADDYQALINLGSSLCSQLKKASLTST